VGANRWRADPGLWVLLPVRGEAGGKSRLAPRMDSVERRRLNRRLLAHTVNALARWQGSLERCIVVTSCMRSATSALQAGAQWLREPLPRRGLNAALRRAAQHARRAGAQRIVVLSVDLPYLSPAGLRHLLHAARGGSRVVLAADREGSGTNAMVLDTAAAFPFAYGAQSRAAHVAIASARGWEVSVCSIPELEFDLDTPRDLALLKRHLRRQIGADQVV
jgi:2-phospho-L-lactate/phosphoenolpyruvate guanylyltransferase